MAIESAVFYVVALALPVWLVVEEAMHRDRRRQASAEPRAAAAPRATTAPSAVPVSRAA
jgi:hypothetical protein